MKGGCWDKPMDTYCKTVIKFPKGSTDWPSVPCGHLSIYLCFINVFLWQIFLEAPLCPEIIMDTGNISMPETIFALKLLKDNQAHGLSLFGDFSLFNQRKYKYTTKGNIQHYSQCSSL